MVAEDLGSRGKIRILLKIRFGRAHPLYSVFIYDATNQRISRVALIGKGWLLENARIALTSRVKADMLRFLIIELGEYEVCTIHLF